MKSLTLFWQILAEEYGEWCCISTSKDYEKLLARVEHEGLSFLTITLPSFAKDLQTALDSGCADPSLFRSFHRREGLPVFLGGFLDLVFDRGTGLLLDTPSIDAIKALRHLTMVFAKIEIPCSDARFRSAMENFVECEQIVKSFDKDRSAKDMSDFTRISRLLWSDVLQAVDEDIYYGRITPKHGPGATADKLVGNHKYNHVEWTTRLEGLFPAMEMILPSPSYWRRLRSIHYLEPGAERPVRVIAVPKTLKTPRIIAIEPTCMQYVQQGLLASFRSHLGRADNSTIGFCNPTHGMVGFDDAHVNQDMAREGSISGELATLDLSDASDRVSNQLVRAMLAPHPHVAEGVDACRSRTADVPGQGVIPLAKFASMGSALTFPVEMMVFLTVIFVGIERGLSRSLTRRDVTLLRGQVRIFGDDIIVPVDMVRSVVDSLTAFGLKVNTDKSFWTGRFRESCGKEYYAGEDVSIVRVRRKFPARQSDDPAEIVSLASLRNQLYGHGLWKTTAYLDGVLTKDLKLPWPRVLDSASALGRVSFLGFETQRFHPHTHGPLVKAFVPYAVSPDSKLDDIGALVKVFIKPGHEPIYDPKHLDRYGRPDAVGIKRRWTSPL